MLTNKSPITLHVKDFDQDSIKQAYQTLNQAIEKDQTFLPVVIDSFGGDGYELLGMVDLFMASPIPIATIVLGKACSSGACLSAMGTIGYRYIAPNAFLMHHHAWLQSEGRAPTALANMKHLEEFNTRFLELVSTHTNHEPRWLQDQLKSKEGADWYLTPQEAKDLNLIDHIKVPTIEGTDTKTIWQKITRKKGKTDWRIS